MQAGKLAASAELVSLERTSSAETNRRQVALRFLLRHPETFVIPKASSVAHVTDNAGAAGLDLSEAELARIDAAFPRGKPRRGVPMI